MIARLADAACMLYRLRLASPTFIPKAMSRKFVVAAVLASCLATPGWSQAPSAPLGAAASTQAKPIATKPAGKTKPAAKPQIAAEGGRCRLGVIAAIGARFSVQKFGITILETEENEVSIEDWGLDELAFARVRAAAGADPGVRRITYPKGAFEPYYSPKSRFLPDPHEGLPAIVRSATPNANCERYLVVTTFKGELAGTHLLLKGVGTYNQGLGSLLRHSHLFANIQLTLIDGKTYDKLDRQFANFGARLANSLRVTEDPLTKLDNSLFPDPPASASKSATLRERTRTLVAATLDQTLPAYLKEE